MNKFETSPLSATETQNGKVQDWGESMSNITLAIGQLEEAVPNGQVDRSAKHLVLLEHNVQQLRRFMEIRGVIESAAVEST